MVPTRAGAVEWRHRLRAVVLFAGIAAFQWLLFFGLRAGTILRDPSFAVLQEAMAERSSLFTDLRLRWANGLGASADEPLLVVGGASALQMAAGRENLEFLRRGVRYSTREHVRTVLEEACGRRTESVVKTLREKFPEIECDFESGRTHDPKRPHRRMP